MIRLPPNPEDLLETSACGRSSILQPASVDGIVPGAVDLVAVIVEALFALH